MPTRRWLWFGLVVELAKPLCATVCGFAEGLGSAATEIHSDLVAHYNWLRAQDSFHDAVVADIEGLPITEV